MARTGAVWGIDVGQCALKALRCRATAAADKIEADAFDYIEYPKILSQPDANPAELIDEALKQFLSRNSVRGDSVAISVSGQAGLARFIKLPPVEARKIPDIVRYEAKQQIPFDLNDVIWDYQRLGIGTEEEGYALETEIGLFAMKREAVFRALEPFQKAGIEIDFVQLTPLALYNYLLFDQLRNLPKPDEYDPENPPESTVILSLGTDATDLVITNGYKVWQRSIPLGGNHFTKALTKEMKLTFAKAEHLKRNATAAADPKAVFQAMRPVFNELLTQLQRSIGYFSNLERSRENRPDRGLGQCHEAARPEALFGPKPGLRNRAGAIVPGTGGFAGPFIAHLQGKRHLLRDMLRAGVAGFGQTGIAHQPFAQGNRQGSLDQAEKALGGGGRGFVAVGLRHQFRGLCHGHELGGCKLLETGHRAGRPDVIRDSNALKSEANTAESSFKSTDQIGQHLVGNVEGRIRWLELIRAIDSAFRPTKSRMQMYPKTTSPRRMPLPQTQPTDRA